MDSKKLLDNAKKNADKFLGQFSLTGNYDLKKIKEALSDRLYNGKPVKVTVVTGPLEAEKAIKPILEKHGGLSPWNNIWDYYSMAFYESIYKANKDIFESNTSAEFALAREFVSQSMFDAFANGLGFYVGMGNVAIAVARPLVRKDPEDRIHCDNGPAIVWGEDETFYWHGIQVERDWIMNKDKVDANLCLTHPNMEQRRALCEIIGWGVVIDQLGAKPIQKDKYGELFQVTLPGATQKDQFVKVLCGTGRPFYLCVSSTAKTAHEAVAESYDMSTEMYSPEVRT